MRLNLVKLTCSPTMVTSRCFAKKSDRSQFSRPVTMNAMSMGEVVQ